jgi:hypothetical protein
LTDIEKILKIPQIFKIAFLSKIQKYAEILPASSTKKLVVKNFQFSGKVVDIKFSELVRFFLDRTKPRLSIVYDRSELLQYIRSICNRYFHYRLLIGFERHILAIWKNFGAIFRRLFPS